ncbi:hypothetical protein OHS70_00395 [Streptomyces sp. NBC_00390]|uniref:hypothetical protein n=1 Tax=Streptomyces sp. NBC_00390 TaxID=2975736 RepID=UPI002E250C19
MSVMVKYTGLMSIVLSPLLVMVTLTLVQQSLSVRGIRLDEPVTVYDVARQLPTIADLRNLSRSLAMLDAILSPDWEGRYYSFNAGWAAGVELASMRNGSGDEY